MMPQNNDDLLRSGLHAALEELGCRASLYGVAAVVNQMVRSAVDEVPSADAGAGISIEGPHSTGAHGSTSDEAAELDAWQHNVGEGPCLSVLRGPPDARAVIMAGDLAGRDAQWWPRFAPAAVRLGVNAVLSLQLPTTDGVGAALNFYGRAVGGFEPADMIMADAFVGPLASLLFGKAATTDPETQTQPPEVQDMLRARLTWDGRARSLPSGPTSTPERP